MSAPSPLTTISGASMPSFGQSPFHRAGSAGPAGRSAAHSAAAVSARRGASRLWLNSCAQVTGMMRGLADEPGARPAHGPDCGRRNSPPPRRPRRAGRIRGSLSQRRSTSRGLCSSPSAPWPAAYEGDRVALERRAEPGAPRARPRHSRGAGAQQGCPGPRPAALVASVVESGDRRTWRGAVPWAARRRLPLPTPSARSWRVVSAFAAARHAAGGVIENGIGIGAAGIDAEGEGQGEACVRMWSIGPC